MHAHPTTQLWQREEDGSYKAELDGHTLHVKWTPETAGKRGFSYVVETPGGDRIASDALEEEIENAMVHAENVVRERTL